MSRIGITGHSNIAPDAAPVILDALRFALTTHSEGVLVGVSCLARGADQLFARAVLELGGTLEVVLPAADYRERKVKADNAAAFDELLARAADVRTMPYEISNREAYLAASEHVMGKVEGMLAVWDGQPGDGRGGTGDVVQRAQALGIPVTVVWPEGAVRAR